MCARRYKTVAVTFPSIDRSSIKLAALCDARDIRNVAGKIRRFFFSSIRSILIPERINEMKFVEWIIACNVKSRGEDVTSRSQNSR